MTLTLSTFCLRLPRRAGLVFLAVICLPVCFADTSVTTPTADQIISKARAALGLEAKLTAVKTLKISGSVMGDQGQPIGTVEILYKKPNRMRQDFHANPQSPSPDNNSEVTQASDGVISWAEVIDKTGQKKISGLKPIDAQQNVYMAQENLYFFRATDHVPGSSVSVDGESKYHNSDCWKISFKYPNGLTLVRYIDTTSGDLHGTILEPQGLEIIESGKQTVGGIVFATELKNYDKDGKLVQTIKFDHVQVNVPVDDKLFDMPSLKSTTSTSSAPKTPASSNSATPAPISPSVNTSLPPIQIKPLGT